MFFTAESIKKYREVFCKKTDEQIEDKKLESKEEKWLLEDTTKR